MSDARLRELERRWKETGSPDDEAAYLRHLTQAGVLDPQWLKLAAYCGHPAAELVAPTAKGSSAEAEVWIRGLTAWGRKPLVRAAEHLARIILGSVSSGPREPSGGAPSAVEEWIACPCPKHLSGALKAGSDAVRGTPLEDAGWCAAAAAAPLDDMPVLLARVMQRAERNTPDVVTAVRADLIAWALQRGAVRDS